MSKLFFLFLSFLFINCHFSNKYENREDDKIKAEEIVNKLFSLIKRCEFEEATKLFDEKFFEVTSKNELINIFETTKNECGNLKSEKNLNSKTLVSEGAVNFGKYILTYDCHFEKKDAKIVLNLLSDETKDIKIVGYSVMPNKK